MVIDASAMVEALVGRHSDSTLFDALAGDVHAPHGLDVEVFSALRGLALGGKLDPARAEDARTDYLALTITRHALSPCADRVWELRHQYTAYDASYLALAEGLAAPLHSCDTKLAAGGHGADLRIHPLNR